jgi:hypothetical protein
MFNRFQLAEQIGRCVSGEQSLDDFEGWFALETHRIRSRADEPLLQIVDSVEHVFSRYHFEGLVDTGAIRELQSIEVFPTFQHCVTTMFRASVTDDSFQNQDDIFPLALGTASRIHREQFAA